MAKSLLSINKTSLKNVRNVSLVVMIALYVYFNVAHPCPKRLVFLLVTTILTFYLFNDIYCAVLLSIVLSMAFTLLCKNRNIVEGLENDDAGDKDNLVDNATTVSNKKKKKKSDKEELTDLDLDDSDNFENDDGEQSFSDNFIDYNKTMRNNLKNLDMKNIEKMTNETKELLDTQKQLMKTMADMAPLLKQGMGMVEMFKKKQKN